MHHSLKGALIAFASVSAFWIAQTMLSQSGTPRDEEPIPARMEANERSLRALKREIETLAARVKEIDREALKSAALGTRLAQLEEQQRSLSRKLDGGAPPAAGAVAPHVEPIVTDANDDDGPPPSLAEQEAETAAWMRDIVGEFAFAFAQEARDHRWSSGTESYILQAWAEFDLAGSELRATDCRRTICRIEVGHDDEEARDRFMLNLAQMMPFAGEAVADELVAGDPSAGMVVYFASTE